MIASDTLSACPEQTISALALLSRCVIALPTRTVLACSVLAAIVLAIRASYTTIPVENWSGSRARHTLLTHEIVDLISGAA